MCGTERQVPQLLSGYTQTDPARLQGKTVPIKKVRLAPAEKR
jgi:hypothetical protein